MERQADLQTVSAAAQMPRSTTVVYLFALLIIASISLASEFLTNRLVMRQQTTALLINTAGRQRMLSQQIARLADETADGSISSAAGRAQIIPLVARMQAAQQRLVEGDAGRGLLPVSSSRLRGIYFEGPVHLQQQVATFLAHARSFGAKSASGMTDPDLLALRQAAAAPLLNGLDDAVTEYQAAAEEDIRQLRHVISSLTATMLVVLLLEALLIYRPLFNRLSSAISLLVKASNTDFLTGAMNRRAFLSCVDRALADAKRLRTPLCLIMADVDRFKSINDTYGHPTGDLVIRHFAALADANLREGDQLARVGGEEFAILLPATTLQGGTFAAERLRERFAAMAATSTHGQPVFATVSIGLLCASAGTADDLFVQADHLLYRAKDAGRNRVEAGHASVTQDDIPVGHTTADPAF